MEDLSTTSFASEPITLSENKLAIHLDKLNEELLQYNLRISSLDDITVDPELSSLNAGDVLKIFVTKIEPDGDWDTNVEKWFFQGVKELEDKFEANSEIISSANLDRGDLVLTLYLNKKGVELDKKFESGGAVVDPKDEELLLKIDKQIENSPAEVLKMVGIEYDPAAEGQEGKLKEAKQKAFEHYKSLEPKPVWVFLHGRKINLAHGATMDSVYLQGIVQGRCYDYAVEKMRGGENRTFAENYASTKGVLGVDMLRGMAISKGLPVFHITDEVLDEITTKVCE